MSTYSDRGLPKARKRYRCYVCGGIIEKGQYYGREGLLKSHFECPKKCENCEEIDYFGHDCKNKLS